MSVCWMDLMIRYIKRMDRIDRILELLVTSDNNEPELVGGLVAMFYFPINIGLLIIPIDSYFSEGFKPPTR